MSNYAVMNILDFMDAIEDKEEVVLCEVEFDKIKEVRSRIPYLEEYDLKLAPQA